MTIHRGFFATTTLQELADAVRSGELTSTALVDHSLTAIETLNPQINAFVHVSADAARQEALKLDAELAAGKWRGPLHGIPVAIKDNIDTADQPTTYGSHLFQHHRPELDAGCVRLLREAGAIVVGKTLTSEFALGPTGEYSFQGGSHNPYNLERVCGGSSAGSAAAVAAGMVPVAIGTDTAGSIRIPAAFCGVVGFKPSYGLVAIDGVYPVSSTLDHIGPIANTISDIDIVMRALSPQLAEQVELAPVQLGWLDGTPLLDVDQRVSEICQQAAIQLFKTPPRAVDGMAELAAQIKSATRTILLNEAYAVHRHFLENTSSTFSAELRDRLSAGADIREEDYLQALQLREKLQRAAQELFSEANVIAMPTTAIVAPSFGLKTVKINGIEHPAREAVNSLTSVWNLLGFPVLSIPAGMFEGLPCGLQLIAQPGRDQWLLESLKHFK